MGAKHDADPASRDLYAEYGVPRDADRHTLEAARRAQRTAWHPDKAGNDEAKRREYEEKSKQINADFELLLDPDARKQYDEERTERVKAEAEEMARQAKYEMRAQQAATDQSQTRKYQDAFSTQEARTASSTRSPPSPPQQPRSPQPPRQQPRPSQPVSSSTLPSFGTIVAILVWGAIALAAYKGCGALIKNGEQLSREAALREHPSTTPVHVESKNLVDPTRFGPVRLGVSQHAVESVLGTPSKTQPWPSKASYEGVPSHPTSTYLRLIYKTGTRQIDVFLCANSDRVATVWSNESRYRSADGFGYGSPEEGFRKTYHYRFGEEYGRGYYERIYYYRRFPALSGLQGRCNSTSRYLRISYGIFNYNNRAERIDSIAVGWANAPPLMTLGRDSYTPRELDEPGELSP